MKILFAILSLIVISSFAQQADPYQLGSKWDKVPVSQVYDQLPQYVQDLTKGVVRVGGGTGFYIGRLAGKDIVLTNHHVCPKPLNCVGQFARFTKLRRNYSYIVAKVTELLATEPTLDVSILEVKFSNPQDKALADRYKVEMDWDAYILEGRQLISIGFGSNKNPNREMMIDASDDCRQFSRDSYVRLIPDPDQLNPADYKVWSIVIGCDVSHGDSGSPLFDRNTGKVVAYLWTGSIPKVAQARDSEFLKTASSEFKWKNLNFAIPTVMLKKYIRSILEK